MKLLRFFLCLSCLFQLFFPLIHAYSKAQIEKNAEILPIPDLLRYRGPILQDAWYYPKGQRRGEGGAGRGRTRNKDAGETGTEGDGGAGAAGGEIESTNSNRRSPGICSQLFRKALETANTTWPPPKTPPTHLLSEYLMGNKMELLKDYIKAEQQNGGEGYDWNSQVMKQWRSKKNTCGGYNNKWCDIAMKKYSSVIEGKSCAVIGSQTPWAEAALFNHGAANVTTIEYMKIKTNYPGLITYHPSEIAQAFLRRQWNGVDVAFSYSSIEHDGLGRYGDPLNPYGDFESMGRMRCLLKPNGILFFSVPVAPDAVVWNAHRLYGKYRLALMLIGWKLLDIIPETCDIVKAHGHWGCQPVMILQKYHH